MKRIFEPKKEFMKTKSIVDKFKKYKIVSDHQIGDGMELVE